MSTSIRKNIIRQRPRLLYAGIQDCGSGWIAEKHAAENVELILIGKGSGKAEVGNTTYPFAAGDLLVCNRGCEHREYFDDTPEKELIFVGIGNLHLYGQEPDTILRDNNFVLVHTEDYFLQLRCYMTQLVAETEGTQPFHESIAEHLVKILLMFAVRLVGFDNEYTYRENMSYLEAKRYFDEHVLEITDIDSVCKSLFINKYYLSHLFSRNAGMPPLKYLITRRIEMACNYLETTEMNVADVGKACGYADPCYFSRMFKKVKGVTPLRYRYLFKLDKANKKAEEKDR